jgi:ABC-type cobalamin/Fe3+-siderophores transport system ATPase subunit
MIIDKFFVPADESSALELAQIEMKKLGRFVALTGKNGAGKTRVLGQLLQCIGNRNAHIHNLGAYEESITAHLNAINNHPEDHESQPAWKQHIANQQKLIGIASERVFSAKIEAINPIHFVPKELKLVDARSHNKQALLSQSHAAKTPGINGFENYCFSYVQRIQDREWAASHQRATQNEAEKNDAKNDYEKLVTIIELLLKTKLDRSIDDDATLFGKPLAEAGLSDGQKVLIQLAVALHAQNKSLKNSIFILDEPENHLHPSALIEFLDALSSVAENSQFWIATHSVPLLAHIAQTEPASIWYVEDGVISNAGTNPLKVLRGLLGDDNQIAALNNFTSLPAQFAAINHAIECLFPPKVVGKSNNDPQVAQINDLLNLQNSDSKSAILDFGAGKSRLLSGLDELATNQDKKISESLDYFAYDSFPDDREISTGVISEIYGDTIKRHFSTREEFFSNKDNSSIDVVVMCNVFHEIPPDEWLTMFDNQSLINRSLKDTGYILVVEDQKIPSGEKAHKFGFLVLDTSHLKTLFNVTADDLSNGLFAAYDYKNDGRLKAHIISKKLLNRLSIEGRKKAIEELRATAEDNIMGCRNKEPSYKTGQIHGFWTQQFANASLYLKTQ